MVEITSREKLNKVRGEITALQTSLNNFAGALDRQRDILARLWKRVSPGKDQTLQDTLASIVALKLLSSKTLFRR